MSESGFDLGLDDATRAGVFFVADEDLDPIAAAGRDAGLLVRRVDLAGCRDKPTLMLRMAMAMDFPSGSGRNWDALSDRLRDLGWLPAEGYALLFRGAGDLREVDESGFETLLDILDEAVQAWAGQDVPFWAFLALPESDFSEMN
ncbi:barstar family protein [Pseudoxanthomonas wuyuanensis]